MAQVEIPKPIYLQHTKLTRPISNYTIFGERHSGTNWLEKIINTRLNLPIKNDWGKNSSKHFIRYLDWNKLTNSHNTLFICITRNIYDWIGGFYKLPHHVDARICGSKEDFITCVWASGEIDFNFITGKPYHNIFDMRKNKLIFYYDYLSLLVDNLIIVRYEDLLINPENIIDSISENFNVKKTNKNYGTFIKPRIKKPYKLSLKIKQIINNNTNWDIETKYNYCCEDNKN